MDIYREERWQRILQMLAEQGRLQVTDIAREMKVSEVTVRRDLEMMDKNNLLCRTHGGAIRVPEHTCDSMPVKDLLLAPGEKAIIEEAQEILATEFKSHSQSAIAFFDGSPMTRNLLRGLSPDYFTMNFEAITNSLDVASDLMGSGCCVKLLGGEPDLTERVLYGEWSKQCLKSVTMDIAFLCVDNIDVGVGIHMKHERCAQLYEEIIQSANITVILAHGHIFKQHRGYPIIQFNKNSDLKRKVRVITYLNNDDILSLNNYIQVDIVNSSFIDQELPLSVFDRL